ncbi:MAG: DUF1353 domain-containing protein [Planctomycetia bacterium]|nr:DUF1353 domain-containing protein [Planctomycetia bacterium]
MKNKPRFVTKLQMEHVCGTESYKLLSPLICFDEEGERWELKIGMVSDGHSIPKLLRSFAGSPFATKFPRPAWFHDFWCRTGIIPRSVADRKYRGLLRLANASKYIQYRNYIGVRVGAGLKWISKRLPWNKRAKQLKK